MDMQDLHGYYFEELSVGMTASFGKTITDADVVMFSAFSGDLNPSHINEAFSETTRMKTRVVRGMLNAGLISAVLGWPRLPVRQPDNELQGAGHGGRHGDGRRRPFAAGPRKELRRVRDVVHGRRNQGRRRRGSALGAFQNRIEESA